MSEGYWIYNNLRNSFNVEADRQILKSPDSITELVRLLKHKRGDRVTLTPEFLQRDNNIEFVTIYENKGISVAERYASLSVCDSSIEELMPVITLAKDLEDCVTEDEKQLWLRIAAPVADSSMIFREEFQIINRIDHPYLEKNKESIRIDAGLRKILYHVHSSYMDKEQVMTDLALKHAF